MAVRPCTNPRPRQGRRQRKGQGRAGKGARSVRCACAHVPMRTNTDSSTDRTPCVAAPGCLHAEVRSQGFAVVRNVFTPDQVPSGSHAACYTQANATSDSESSARSNRRPRHAQLQIAACNVQLRELSMLPVQRAPTCSVPCVRMHISADACAFVCALVIHMCALVFLTPRSSASAASLPACTRADRIFPTASNCVLRQALAHTHARAHAHTQAPVRHYTRACMCTACAHARAHVRTSTRKDPRGAHHGHASARRRARAPTQRRQRTNTHASAHIHTHKPTRAHTHIHAHKHTRARARAPTHTSTSARAPGTTTRSASRSTASA